jgi:Holliday junction resolvasome RuvABC DNA-binding subunit
VLELRDKVGAIVTDDDLAGAGLTGGATTPLGEVREALASLGYGAGEIQAAMADLDPDGDTSDLLRRALRSLGAAAVGGGR